MVGLHSAVGEVVKGTAGVEGLPEEGYRHLLRQREACTVTDK